MSIGQSTHCTVENEVEGGGTLQNAVIIIKRWYQH